MASSSVGGLSGAFIPVSEDEGMISAVRDGALSLAKLEAMTETIPLAEVIPTAARQLEGQVRGRLVVDVNA